MSERIDVQEVLKRLDDEEEARRYKALVAIRDAKVDWSADLIRALRRLENDPSRPVRQLARELLDQAAREVGQEGGDDGIPVPLEPDDEPYPGTLLMALMSWGSAFTGVAFAGLSLVNYFTLGRFPFPRPFEVLTAVLLGATLPYILIGVMLLTPGRAQKRLALFYAYFSLFAFAVLTFALGPIFEAYWAIQFKLADQALFRHFLSPLQLAMLFLPVFAGQGLLIYYLNLHLAQADARRASNRVDTGKNGV